ncbi:MAG: MFS transporter [Lachnospiraceae bacterium]|nr:MFS transporter [Lachnospiraceae bacterium]
MNIKKQTRLLYVYEALISFRMVDAVWVIFLLGRGCSLAEVGIAEGVFHVTSMIFEIPSGMAADLFGRRRTLIFSGLMGMCSGVFMAMRGWSGWIYAGMIFSALSFNLASGTEEAITYDSMLETGCAEEYKKVRSGIGITGRVFQALACTLSPVAIALGYRYTYLISAGLNLAAVFCVMGLKEPAVTQEQQRRSRYSLRNIGVRLKRHICDTVVFIREHPRTMGKLFADAAVACPCYLVMMYLQEHLVNCGWPREWIGLPMLLIPLSGAAGTWMAARSKMRFFKIVLRCGILGGLGTCLTGSGWLPVIIFGACIVQACEGFSEVAVSESVNRDFTSDQRATLISIDSMLYSVLMVAASPLTGFLGSCYSVSMIFYVLGGTLLVASTVCFLVF